MIEFKETADLSVGDVVAGPRTVESIRRSKSGKTTYITLAAEEGRESYTYRQATVTRIAVHVEDHRASHDCYDNAVPYVSDGPLGHGWECGICGAFLQAG